MSDKQNMTEEMLKAWQDYLQNSLSDPKMAELMLLQYSKFQDFIKASNESTTHSENVNQRTSNDVDVQHNDLSKRIDALEARLINIETIVSRVNSSK